MSAGDMSSTEVTINVGVVSRLVADSFPAWADLPVTPVAKPGVDNATYRLGSGMSVRLPRFERWVGQVHCEQRWLPALAPHLPFTIPQPLAQGEPTAEYPFPWSVYRWLPGDRARREDLDPMLMAADLAAFLTALWSIDTTDGPPPRWDNGFRGCAIADERDSPLVESWIRARIADRADLIDADAATAVYESALAAPVLDGPPVWVHGDPAAGNLLAADGRLDAVIDFGTLAVGDPACDIGIAAWSWLDGPARLRLRELLQVDDATWARGRGWGLTAVLPNRADLAAGGDRELRARTLFEDLVADLAPST
ncbi:aminoglycoside phosphotransferase family protein [Actinokineospora enzanensis]|uniref:aminoglycoside phosphotransferase family protein n=1 Tax=Actinokineospora enzanensis TaxID=155975 RepID=UPI000372AE76|nr:aminoglycoside phosphotransferase family protein [Actinokineospora enzanensis]